MAEVVGFELESIYYVVLFAVAIFAGFIDSWYRLAFAFGRLFKKCVAIRVKCACLASFTATLTYFKSLTMKHLAWGVFFTALGAALGVWAVLLINDKHLKLIILVFLIATFLYMAFKPNLGKQKSEPKITNIKIFHIFIGFSLGFYDGFLGPGTGSFLIFACVMLLGYNLKEASITIYASDQEYARENGM